MEPEALIGKEAVAEQLGIRVTHLEYLVRRRRIPFVKVGSLVRFKPSDIARWIEENYTEAQP